MGGDRVVIAGTSVADTVIPSELEVRLASREVDPAGYRDAVKRAEEVVTLRGSPTRSLSGRSLITLRSCVTEHEADGMPRENRPRRRPDHRSDPTRNRALELISAQKIRRKVRRRG